MNGNLIITNQHKSSVKRHRLPQKCTRERTAIPVLLLLLISIFVTVTPASAALQQVFVDGQSGRFQQARSELQSLSDELQSQVSSADIMIVGRNCAAIGFYSMLSQVSSDCISNTLSAEYGKKLFTAAQNAASGQLNKAASLAKEVADARPNYPPAQLLLARIRMGNCMQFNQDCNASIKTYQRALEMDNTLSVAYLDLGMLYLHMGKNQEAIAVWENATKHAQGQAATKLSHMMLALVYSIEKEWTQAKKHSEIARDFGFTGFAAELLDEIQRHISTESTSVGQESAIERKKDSNATKTDGTQNVEPNFITGLVHGLTSPLRSFGLLGLHYIPKKNWTDSYALGLLIGCLLILSIGIGLFKGKK